MSNKKNNIQTPEIKRGEAVEIFACGGQCQGQNNMPFIDTEMATDLKVKVG